MDANKYENSYPTVVLIVLRINLVILFIQIGGLLGITAPVFECNNEMASKILGSQAECGFKTIYAWIESFILLVTVIPINKKKSFMIPYVIAVIFVEVFIYCWITVCIFYENVFRILRQTLVDQSPEDVKSEEISAYMYWVVFFTMSIYFGFKYYSLMVLYKYNVQLRNEWLKSRHGRSDVESVPGLRAYGHSGYPDAPPPYDFHSMESAMSGYM